jgi:serine/threonine-protein kinase RsbW
MHRSHKITRAAELESLADFRAFIDQTCAGRADIDESFRYALKLAVEEACTNVITHGYAGLNPGSMILTLDLHPDRVTITLTDFGHAFEPSEPAPPDVVAGLDDQPTGGFGLYFIYQSMDEVDYQTTDDCNSLILTKKIEAAENKTGE